MSEQELKQKALTIVEESQEIVIFSPEDNEVANSFLKASMELEKAVNSYWKDPIEKANKLHRSLTEKRKEMLKPILLAKSRLKGKISEYLTKKRAERERKEKELREEAKKNGGFTPEVTIDVEKPQGQVVRKIYYAEIVDESIIPRKYLLVNTSMLDKLAKAEGLKASVPGVVFKERLSVSARA